ncbi:hypothetical protein ACQEU6_23275 [Spirillospora sp. CA-108201]
MPELTVVTSSRVPSGSPVLDFDLIDRDGRLLIVCTDFDSRVFCWDPTTDQWTAHRLDIPSDAFPAVELTEICAAVVDGRIVVGGGGDHQDFAQWDLETGTVLEGADGGGVSSARAVTLGGRTLFVIGYTGPAIAVQSPAKHDGADTGVLDGEEPREDERDSFWTETDELECGGSIATGTLGSRPVIASLGVQGGIIVWDIEEECPVTELDEPDGIDDAAVGHFALATVKDRVLLIAAGERVLSACDLSAPDAPEWAEPIIVPGGDIECLDATVVNGRAVAATGGGDGTFCIWDMADRRLLAEPNTAHGSSPYPDAPSEVFAVRFAELNTRPVAITCGRDGTLRVWNLPSTGNDKRS